MIWLSWFGSQWHLKLKHVNQWWGVQLTQNPQLEALFFMACDVTRVQLTVVCWITISPARSWYWRVLALASFALRSTGRSKKFTSTCSVSNEARTCSKLTDQLLSDSDTFPPVTVEWPCSCSSWPVDGRLRCRASPICSTRLATIPMAWKSSASSGSPWNMLYSVLQNWINSRW